MNGEGMPGNGRFARVRRPVVLALFLLALLAGRL
jgi:hypothetical protein